MKKFLLAAALAASCAFATAANATQIYMSGSGPDGSFWFISNATSVTPGTWQLTGGVVGLETRGPTLSNVIYSLSTYALADQLLSGSPTDLRPDFWGVSFKTFILGDYNIFTGLDGNIYELESAFDPIGQTQNAFLLDTFNAHIVPEEEVAAPEPMTVALFAGGLLVLRRNAKRQSNQLYG